MDRDPVAAQRHLIIARNTNKESATAAIAPRLARGCIMTVWQDVAKNSIRDAVQLWQRCIPEFNTGMKPACFGQQSFGCIETDRCIAVLAKPICIATATAAYIGGQAQIEVLP